MSERKDDSKTSKKQLGREKPVAAPVPTIPPVLYEEEVLVPQLNFAMVSPGIYRSGYPNKKNFPFLKKLKLKSTMYLAEEDHMPEYVAFMEEHGITQFIHKLKGNKEPFEFIPKSVIATALVTVLDRRNHPILIHCNKGKHRVGSLVGCLRKLQKWSLTSVFDEYRRFAGKAVRIADQQFIELFDEKINYNKEHKPSWLDSDDTNKHVQQG